MTETKLAYSKYHNKSLTHPIYYLLISNYITENTKKQESNIGTALAIYHKLRLYIYNIYSKPNIAIRIDLFFLYNNKIHIIVTYLLLNNNKLNIKIQNTIIN